MRRNIILFIIAICVALGGPFVTSANGKDESDNAYKFKIAVQDHLEQRLGSVLREVSNTNNVVVVVTASIAEGKEGEAQEEEFITERDIRRSVVLPGVPIRSGLGQALMQAAGNGKSAPLKIASLDVTVLVDKGVHESMIQMMRDVAINIIGYNPDRGDRLEIRPVDFPRQDFQWSSMIYPPNIYWLILVVFGSICLIAASRFFMNPFRTLPSSAAEINWEALRGSASHSQASLTVEAAGAAMPVSAGASFSHAAASSNGHSAAKLPFSFISDEHLGDLSFLLKNDSSEDIALIINYMSPESATRLLDSFGPDKQAEIMLNLAATHELPHERVKALEDDLKSRLGCVVGGSGKIASLLTFAREDVRDKVMSTLGQKDAEAALALKKQVLSFEALMETLSPEALQTVVRRLDLRIFAQLLSTLDERVQSRVLGALSEGFAERIIEEAKYSKPLGAKRMRREKQALVLMVQGMMNAGQIEEDQE